MRNRKWNYILLYSLLFVTLWIATAWVLLNTFQWSTSLSSILVAVCLSYLVSGLLMAVPVAMTFVHEFRQDRQQRGPVRVFIPAEVLRLHRRS